MDGWMESSAHSATLCALPPITNTSEPQSVVVRAWGCIKTLLQESLPGTSVILNQKDFHLP